MWEKNVCRASAALSIRPTRMWRLRTGFGGTAASTPGKPAGGANATTRRSVDAVLTCFTFLPRFFSGEEKKKGKEKGSCDDRADPRSLRGGGHCSRCPPPNAPQRGPQVSSFQIVPPRVFWIRTRTGDLVHHLNLQCRGMNFPAAMHPFALCVLPTWRCRW